MFDEPQDTIFFHPKKYKVEISLVEVAMITMVLDYDNIFSYCAQTYSSCIYYTMKKYLHLYLPMSNDIFSRNSPVS